MKEKCRCLVCRSRKVLLHPAHVAWLFFMVAWAIGEIFREPGHFWADVAIGSILFALAIDVYLGARASWASEETVD